MSRKPSATILCLLIIGLLIPAPSDADCGRISSFASSQKPSKLHVRAARAPRGNNDPIQVVTVLLGEYLLHAKPPKKPTTVTVDVAETGKDQYRATVVLGEKRFDAPFSFPNTMNGALVGLAEGIAGQFKSSLKDKKLLPFLNETDSSVAYLRYAEGAKALRDPDGIDRSVAERARAAFEEAIKADYNYVQAYAGLSEALAALAVLEDSKPLRLRAKTEMQKAKLLNPYRAKWREKRMKWYLEKSRCLETGPAKDGR